MTIYYIDPQAATNGNGLSPVSPMNTFVNSVWVAGNRIRVKRGSVYTGAFSPAAGGSTGSPLVIEAYANTDGSDDIVKPRPVLNITVPVSTYASANKDYVEYHNLDIRANLTVVNDSAPLFCGMSTVVDGCSITSNTGCIASWNKNNVVITNNTFDGVTHGNANNNNLLIVSADGTNIDNILIKDNVFIHRGGGGSSSHCIRAETTSTYVLTRLKIINNTITPPAGTSYSANQSALGIRIACCPSAIVRNNRVYGMQDGLFAVGGSVDVTGVVIEGNDFSNNYHFGIHLTTGTHNFIIQINKCWGNGTSIVSSVLNAYGRGIEISSSGGQNVTGGHTIQFNSCCYNKNYGGPADNGSEGVGIGLDDGTINNLVYANYVAFNEGNGIQLYGGVLSETGGNKIVANYLDTNCTNSVTNRRSGSTLKNAFNAHVSLSNIFGKQSIVANNIMMGPTLVGISETANCANAVKANNIFYDVRYPISISTGYNCFNNVFFAKAVTVVKYSTGATYDSSGNPTFTTLNFSGVNDFIFDPQLDRKFRPKAGSPCIGTGIYIGSFNDYTGRPFKIPMSIGPYETY
jgi:hypothetical protein